MMWGWCIKLWLTISVSTYLFTWEQSKHVDHLILLLDHVTSWANVLQTQLLCVMLPTVDQA
jgi:hypothetical protein